MTKSYTKFRNRISFISSLFILVWTVLAFRFFHIQIYNGDELRKKSIKQSTTKKSIQAVRGSISDRNGYELASNITHYSFGIQPKAIENKENIIKVFCLVTGKSKKFYEEKFENDSFQYLERNLLSEKVKNILQIKDKGLIIEKQGYRTYPHKNIGSQIIGFTDTDNNGIEGIEKQYNKILSGTEGWIVLEKDAKQKTRKNRSLPQKPSIDGSNIKLTIDLQYQGILQDELNKRMKKSKAKGAMGVLIEPKSGKILAISSVPDFDPNQPAIYKSSTYRNRPITDQFEPGSTFKIVPAIAALNDKIVSSNEEFHCGDGSYFVGKHEIKDWKEFGLLTFAQIIANSSNVGTVKIAELVGRDRIYDFGRKLGFGRKTGISFPGEAKGVFKNTKKWSSISLAEISIGYEVAVTSLQLAMAYSALANNGFLMKPFLVEEISSASGKLIYKAKPKVIKKVASEEAVLQLTEMLEMVVSNGTGEKAGLPGWNVAGKTGTAKKYERGGYSSKNYIASFAGFFPSEDPQVAGVIILDEPKKGLVYGGENSAPVFGSIVKRIVQVDDNLVHYKKHKINDDNNKKEINQKNEFFNFQKKLANDINFKNNPNILLTKGNIIDKNTSTQILNEGYVRIPDLKGKSMRKVINILNDLKLKPKIEGSGIVYWQFPKPGQIVKEGIVCKVGLK